jgi:FAD dependent oxidoreductase
MRANFRYAAASILCATISLFLPICLQAESQKSYDIVIAGAGTGGAAAAIEAGRLGASVALLEESDWIGGQMAAAGVSTMDEGMGPKSTPPSGFYADYLDRIRAFYREHGKSINTCYWNVASHCFDPRIARQILNGMIADVNSGKGNAPHGHIDLYLRDRVVRVLSTGDMVTGVVTSQDQTFESKVLIDATEYGDVLPLTPARYRSGRGIGEDRQSACIQAITWTATIKKYPQGVPPELQMHTPPPGYDAWVTQFRRSMRADGNPVNRNLPVDLAMYAVYRGVPDLSNPKNYTAMDSRQITRTSMNWFNDFDVTTALYDRSQREKINCQAKLKTLANLYYIQNEMGEKLWSVANDEEYDSAYSKANSCPEVPAEYKTIEQNLPQIPYVRESNRLVGVYTLTAGDLRREDSWVRSVRGFTDAVAVGDYADDLHGCNSEPGFFETDLEHITDLPPGFRFGPFQVPLRSFIPEKVDGLLAAEKNISQSRLANGATRLQPITMLTGQAAGALAALAVTEHLQPRNVSPDKVQITLLQSGDILARETMPGLAAGTKAWQAAQFALVHQWIVVSDRDGFQPAKQLTRADLARILVNAFLSHRLKNQSVVNTGGFDPAPQILDQAYNDVPLYDPIYNSTAALHAAGAAPVCSGSPKDFCPGYSISIGDLLHSTAIFIAAGGTAHAPGESALRAGITGTDQEPATFEDAAIILYNAALSRIAE